jgi:hypothetical protein
MKKLIYNLGLNSKVSNIKKEIINSLDDEIEYSEIRVVLNTKKNLFDWAKTIYIKPADEEGFYNVHFYMGADHPQKTILKEIYESFKSEDFKKAKYGHDKPMVKLVLSLEYINKIINYFYSKIN